MTDEIPEPLRFAICGSFIVAVTVVDVGTVLASEFPSLDRTFKFIEAELFSLSLLIEMPDPKSEAKKGFAMSETFTFIFVGTKKAAGFVDSTNISYSPFTSESFLLILMLSHVWNNEGVITSESFEAVAFKDVISLF